MVSSLHLLLGLASLSAASPSAGVVGGHETLSTRADDDAAAARGTYWYEKVRHNGFSPFIAHGRNWTVFRNVKTDFGARGDGVTDDSAAIQAALDFAFASAADGPPRGDASLPYGTTGSPALVYLPRGTYRLDKPLQSYIDTVIMGDPVDPPVLQASPDFADPFLVYGFDHRLDPTINFYIGLKNVVLDSTRVPAARNVTLLNWAVSQAVQLANVEFRMGGAGHTGLSMPQGGSPLMMNDLLFDGGAVGIRMNEQQYHFKGLTFKNMGIGLKLDKLFEGTGQALRFESCDVGIETTNNNTGFFALIDSSATDVRILWNAAASPTAQGSMVLENVQVDGSVKSTVTAGGKNVLTGPVRPGQVWIWGDVYGPADGERAEGKFFSSKRPAGLVDASGSYPTVKPPTFQELDVRQVVNVKNVCGWPVAGDGVTDDTKSLQHIIDAAAGKKLLYFPHGTYLVSDTLVIPPGTRFHGEVWSEIAAIGPKFSDAAHPRAMIQVGQPGQRGLAQFVDMLFTVADILPGCKLVEVHMAGDRPGDVGFWNSHFRIGGARSGGRAQTACSDPATCRAARLCAHLAPTSSSYWENSWCWSADHDLDDDFPANPSTAGGFLVESDGSRGGTWLLGIGSEHNALYQVSIHAARDVLLAFQQSEVPYWQGAGSGLPAPQPWQDAPLAGDPSFSWCTDPDDEQCRMGVYQYVADSRDVRLYGAGFWTFFNGLQRKGCSGECQDNAAIYVDNEALYSFGISTHNVRNMVLEGERNGTFEVVATDKQTSGGWQSGGGVLAAYLRQA